MIIGTAGHIDHGKTSLIAGLTGKNTDRLPEEQRRGISIELGYAYLALEDQRLRLGFVDVPGHEKFVHAMLSGATGIDHALLVVAADDGPMPQTREHLEILRLLGVESGTVAITKVDAVEPAQLVMARFAVQEMLESQHGSDWPIFEVSSTQRTGLDDLLIHLTQVAANRPCRESHGGFRLAVDRSFVLPGLGTIVTGTVHAGHLTEGEEIIVQPRGLRGRVRSMRAEDLPAQSVRAGSRVALNIAGVGHEEVGRGDWICQPNELPCVLRFDAEISVTPHLERPLRAGLEVHFHHGTADLLAKVIPLTGNSIEPGRRALVGISLPRPVQVCHGDRFVLRDSQARNTLAGGRVLDCYPPTRGQRTPERLALLEGLAADQIDLERLWSHSPLAESRLSALLNLRPEELDGLLTQQLVVRAAGQIFHPGFWTEAMARMVSAIDETHTREPEMPGLELQRLRRMGFAQLSPEAYEALIQAVLATGDLVQRGAFLARPAHKAELDATEEALWQRIRPLLADAPFNPPRVRDIAKGLNLPEGQVRNHLRKVARIGDVTLVALDHFFLTESVAQLADIAQTIHAREGALLAADFRDAIGGGRKVAIHILEFFDRVGFSRRLKDNHLIRRSNPWSSAS
ncbi:MAG: selenocysteine-specific translation elongation factor [Betaproteobacteria bacterium]|nr:selenocysteine-specific translation elongation factor [Betaproteobacteria bacterium]NBY13842.1 selenocysteine-specific translation elongation factor [Betaproteobacteria bacterium]